MYEIRRVVQEDEPVAESPCRWREHGYPIDRDALISPEILVESFEIDPTKVMRPIFDSIWNAAGWPRSMNYDEAGEWGKGINSLS